jgi:anti-sigma factor RsiW
MLGSYPDLTCCAGVSAHLSEFLDDELDPLSTGRVIVHLASCQGCARVAAELAATVEALHELGRGRGGGRALH